ncbi:MAG: glucan biosynthesis protein G [Hyphomicrobiales bacterium]|nr:glucan biosynthesis protein G [Hyphomicrobiales bacterium]
MSQITRRTASGLIAMFAALSQAPRLAAQTLPGGSAQSGRRARFGFDDVVTRARSLARAEYHAPSETLPPELASLDWDLWRRIRFRSNTSLLKGPGSKFSLQLFHLGHLFKKAVTVNTLRNNLPVPVPYSADIFDYGPVKFKTPLPVNMGFAGFRLHYPLNAPNTHDELISFVGSSYFRWLGRGQKYGLSARGLALNSGLLDKKEEFPFFREFWIDDSEGAKGQVTIYALMDSDSVSGAYKFTLYPGVETRLDVEATVFARKTVQRLGIGALTSMYFLGENDRHMNDRNKYDEFRPELHDSDGLLIHTHADKWVWRPLINPLVQEVHRFEANKVKGFGLMQRDRRFEHYQDIELNYEERPSYWVVPKGDWRDGVIELIELATKDETADNIVCAFVPSEPLEAGKSVSFAYSMYSKNDGLDLHSLAYVKNTFSAPAYALGSKEVAAARTRRLMIDFAGGELEYYLKSPGLVDAVPSAIDAKVMRHFVVPNPAGKGFRVMVDVQFEEDKIGVIQCYLRDGPKLLSETWNYGWRIYDLDAIDAKKKAGEAAEKASQTPK